MAFLLIELQEENLTPLALTDTYEKYMLLQH